MNKHVVASERSREALWVGVAGRRRDERAHCEMHKTVLRNTEKQALGLHGTTVVSCKVARGASEAPSAKRRPSLTGFPMTCDRVRTEKAKGKPCAGERLGKALLVDRTGRRRNERGKMDNKGVAVSRAKVGSEISYDARGAGLDDVKQDTMGKVSKLRMMGREKGLHRRTGLRAGSFIRQGAAWAR